jgi:hypothetical protein
VTFKAVGGDLKIIAIKFDGDTRQPNEKAP